MGWEKLNIFISAIVCRIIIIGGEKMLSTNESGHNISYEETIDKENLSKTDREMYALLKSRLQNLQRKKKIYYICVALGLITGALIVISNKLSLHGAELNRWDIIYPIIISFIVGIFAELLIFLFYSSLENTCYDRIAAYDARNDRGEAQEDIFENSIKMSYKYLDEYYAQTRDQARKGFIITFCVAIFGALLVGFGILMMFLEKTNPSYVTCASGVVTEFIAAIFFYLYNKTITSMSNYHNKLVLSHNISIALKVADSLPELDKAKTKDEIIKELIKDINSHLIVNDSESNKGSHV